MLNVEEVEDHPTNLNKESIQSIHHDETICVPKSQMKKKKNRRSLDVEVTLKALDSGRSLTIEALIDSGATGIFMDESLIKENGWTPRMLPHPIPVYNPDGTKNAAGEITQEIDMMLTLKDHQERCNFSITKLTSHKIILGHNWLEVHNPEIDWKKGQILMKRCPKTCHRIHQHAASMSEESEEYNGPETTSEPEADNIGEGDRIFMTVIKQPEQISAVQTISQRLNEAAIKNSQPQEGGPSLMEMLPKEYHDYEDVFSKTSFDELPPRKTWDHAVELKPGSEPKFCKIYPMNPEEQKQLDEFIEENLRTGRIRPSKSPMASPVFFIKKKDGSLRLVQDYRALNDMTIKNKYPLPLISELVNKLRGAKYFTALDVRWGYNNVRMKEGDEWKAAFRTNRGLFEPLVMFFGLCNSPATFQTMMNELFRELITEGKVVVYIDDILIFTETMEEQIEVVRRVLQILRDNHLYLKPEKCKFHQNKVEYLGLVVSHNSLEMDPVKVKGVAEWPTPKCKKDVQSFLGFVNFYRRFIKDFAQVAKPLHELTGKKDWKWTPRQQESFEALKTILTSTPILRMPTDSDPYRLEADSSDYAIGAVLSQEQEGTWYPIAYMSKSLNDVERNYPIHDKELLAIIRALEEWRHYLEGANHQFEILTDHKNLEYFKTARNLNRRQARWSLFLSRFDFSLHHRPGKSSGKPDALSRRPDHGTGQNDNEDVILLKPELFVQAITTRHEEAEGIDEGLVGKIRRVSQRIKQPSFGEENEWSQEHGLYLFRGKVFVPFNQKMRYQVISEHHDNPLSGHPGCDKTFELISRNYWWPGMHQNIAEYVRTCLPCQRTKTFPTKPFGLLQPNPVPSQPWTHISVDMITGLPLSQGHDSILVIIDRFSKMAELVPTSGELSSEGLARIYRDFVWKSHGLPDNIISDRGPQFASQFMKALNLLLGIKTSLSTAYHPQTDGQTERLNQEVEQYLRLFINHRQDDWVDWLAIAQFSYNNRIQSSTGFSPFYLNYGLHPRTPNDVIRETPVVNANEFAEKISKMHEETRAALQKASLDMKKYADEYRQQAPDYQVGDKVMLDISNLRTTRPSKKLDLRRQGPFEIQEVISRSAYKLKLPTSWKVHPVFHVSLLRPYHDGSEIRPPAQIPPPPEMIDDEPEYEVEIILDSQINKRRKNTLEYLVHWKDYSDQENSWEPVENMANAQGKIREFHKAHPGAIGEDVLKADHTRRGRRVSEGG